MIIIEISDRANIYKTVSFALEIINLCKALQNQREYVISRQILRSATSIGANMYEASSAHTKRDFIYKTSIALKEARETKYWLFLLSESKLAQYDYDDLLARLEEIEKILSRIIITAKHNL